jgi:tellurite resistance protein TehA-like permease
VIWILSAVWLPVLLAGELVARRRGYYHVRRWSTLFPVGMYAASGFEVARVSWLAAAGSFGRVWIWVAIALWLLLSTGMCRQPRSALAAS